VAHVVHVVAANVVYVVYKCLKLCNLRRQVSLGMAGLIRSIGQKPTMQLWFSLVTWNAFGLKVTQICQHDTFEIAEVDNHCWHQLWSVQNHNCVPLQTFFATNMC